MEEVDTVMLENLLVGLALLTGAFQYHKMDDNVSVIVLWCDQKRFMQ